MNYFIDCAIHAQLSAKLANIHIFHNHFPGSIPSLGAGLAFGAILGVGAHFNSQDPPRPLLQLTTSVVLAGIMGARFQRSGKMMPAGMICIISVAAILRNLYTYNRYLPLPGRQQ
ncbi:unnamed protein product [Ceratitis capitata]|uniref:(Mediterranean fruit fly) hypothetical protein n=1 Tax=Ceratitis capitata TaxID=7213 RepID=A0A811V9Y7_CERCA|nr:unnamed protein product [Ceratitis capitata]